MITYIELFALNRVLDGEDIFKVPSFQDHKNKRALINQGKNGLIQKGYLKNESELTDNGVRLIRRLELYKHATYYFNFQSIWIALCKEQGIMLVNTKNDGYDIFLVDTVHFADNLKQRYAFLASQNKSADAQKNRAITSRELFQMYYLDAQNGFLVELIENRKKKISRLYFEYDQKSYKYDIHSHVLKRVSTDTIQNEVQKMISYDCEE